MGTDVGCIIQARMGSSRLPGKVMKFVDKDVPLIHFLLNQLENSKKIEKIVVATTTLEQDDQISNYVTNLGFDCFRGSSDDVLARYYDCSQKFSFSNIVRITSDNPLIDPTLVDDIIKKFKKNNFDYVANCIERTFPYGTETEIFSSSALEIAIKNANLPDEREHVTPYFKSNPQFRIFNVNNVDDVSHLRWTVDTQNDLDFVKIIISKFKKRPILMNDILNMLENNPNLVNTYSKI